MSRPVGALLALNVLLLGAAAVRSPAPPPHPALPATARPVLPLEGTLVHLEHTDGDRAERHASIQLDLELDDERGRGVVLARMPLLREVVLRYFSDRTAAELKAPGSLARLKAELLPRLNGRLPVPSIRSILVTQFVVQ